MLIIYYLLILSTGVLVGLWIAARDGSVEQNTSSVLPYPPDKVFPYLYEPDKIKTWLAGFESSEPINTGSPVVGSRYKTTLKITGHYGGKDVSRIVVIEVEIIEFDPGKNLKIKQISKIVNSEIEYNLLPFNGGTFLKMHATTFYKGPLRLIVHFERKGAQKRAEKDMLALEKAINANT